jgi:integrase
MSIYKRGNIYYYNLWFKNHHVQATTKTSNRKAALDIEAAARVRLAKNEWDLNPEEKRDPLLRELFDGLEQHLRDATKWTVKSESNMRLVRAAFPGAIRASELREHHVDRFISKKSKKSKKRRQSKRPATINRVTGLLKEAYKLANLVPPIRIRHLSEKGNTRQGFLEAADFDRLLEFLPSDLRDFTRFAYLTGWRKNEIATLTWGDVAADEVRLRDVNAKTGHGRSVPLNVAGLADLIARRRNLRRSRFDDQRELVFRRDDRKGSPVREFRKSWKRACKLAGTAGKIFHDLRRTAVRNLVRAGVPQAVAMKISGHETPSMFLRYNIVDNRDIRQAMQSLEIYHQTNAANVVAAVAAT